MHLGQVDIANVVCTVVVKDLPAGPVETLDAKFSTRLEHFHHRNVGMPAIMSFDPRIFRWSLQIELERSLRHDDLPSIARDGACAGAHWLSLFSICKERATQGRILGCHGSDRALD